METVNAMAAAAAKAVWGDSTAANEPVSGKTGNTAAGEPYDAGNADQTDNITTGTTTNTTTGTSESTAAKTPGSGTTGSGSTGSHSTNPDISSASNDAAFAKNTGTAATSSDTPENPSTNQKLKDADPSRGQQDTRDPENPLTNPKSAPTEVNEKRSNDPEDGPNEDIKLDGPGPKPLEEVARERGGDAGNISDRKGSLVPPRDPNDTSEAPKSDQDRQEEKGDGTLYVKSSGLKADGGDFDVTQPGAGREADRLMAEKGMHPNEDARKKSSSPPATDHQGDTEPKEKKKLSQRIKDKLHSH
ncbi:hypothetical protein Micbo1qcDRAFT_230278 [Microdochium bolleyi]|uniref:Glycine-rich cell wall structural protein 1 n=1 Tax=Microdochium bolleyi TaxID=196109 RepID=A0A136JKM0_9PEZI|nr:hypothetical protein Micbo1qcDRAFT_230278 [Microdochium bolleyi]